MCDDRIREKACGDNSDLREKEDVRVGFILEYRTGNQDSYSLKERKYETDDHWSIGTREGNC